MDAEPLHVLLVEDDPDHAELVMSALENQPPTKTVHHVLDGQEAIDYLFGRGDYAGPARPPRPHLILLDLRLPKVDGLAILKEIKTFQDETIRRIPIVVLTSSKAEKDIAAAYDCRANSYVVKPVDFAGFQQLLTDLCFYWLVWNRLAA